jgi:phage terminase large subunit-like protein
LDGPVASWIGNLDEQRRLLPPKVFARLWLNQWADGAGDALDGADIQRAITLCGPLAGPERGWAYCAGLDIGLKRDSSALAVVAKHVGYMDRSVRKPRPLAGVFGALADHGFIDAPRDEVKYTRTPPTGQLKLVAMRAWSPKAGRVELDDIEREILALHRVFKLTRLSFDPWQAEHLTQRLGRAGIFCDPVHFVPSNLQSMATVTLDAFRERTLQLFDHPELIADLKAMRVVEKSTGYRLEMAKGGTEHGDAAQALALALESSRAIRDSTCANSRRLVYS